MKCRAILVTGLLIPTLVGDSRAADVDQYGDVLPPGAVARLGTTRLRQAGVIHAIAFSPDGKTIASLDVPNRLWDVATGQMVERKPGNGETWVVESLAKPLERKIISRDGKVRASVGDGKGVIRITDAATDKELHTWVHRDYLTLLAFPADGKTLISFATRDYSNGPGECRVWDLDTGKIIRHWDDVRNPAVLSPDGKTLLLGAKECRIRLVDPAAGNEFRHFDLPKEEFSVPTDAARCAAFSPDSKLLAVGDMTNRVHVYDVGAGKELHCSPPSEDRVQCLAFSPDGKTLAVGAWHRILLWEARTGKDLLPLGGHANQVNRCRVCTGWQDDRNEV